MDLQPESNMLVLMTTDAVGGVWNYCIRLAEALDAYDVQIALATMGPALNEHQRHEVRRLANVQLYESTFKLEWMRDPWEDVDRAGRWLLDLEERLRPDVIHLNGYTHAALRREYGRRAFEKARTYTLARMAGQYHQGYCTLMRSGATTLAGAL